MAWRIDRRIWSARGACWYFELAVAALLGVSTGWAQPSGPAFVRDCRPCSFSPGDVLPAYLFTFDLKTTAGDERAVAAIEITSEDRAVTQRLPVAGMTPVGRDADFFFGGVDINFDNLLDLMLIVRSGAANAYAAYWLFDPKTKTFRAVGTHPVFRVDARKQRLATHERGGAAGLVHESREYAFLGGQLTLMREEKQEATGRPGVFRLVIRERIGGAMKVIKTETVRPPK